MGLRNCMAKNLAGVSGYGSTMGREAVKNGLALGRTLYVGHGTRATASTVFVFEDSHEMEAAGFTPYCTDPMNRPDEQTPIGRRIRAIKTRSRCGNNLRCNLRLYSGVQLHEKSEREIIHAVGAAKYSNGDRPT